ncbi:hypothetical protein [Streptomyces sp. NPDC088246]|uniref:hypothetical protein n=1 Tax=Streptomyces sp. NPDC088246 TaxID=3365842 RepID=UPI0037FA1A9B
MTVRLSVAALCGSNLRIHLRSAQQALDETRTVLAGPTRATTSQPSKPVGDVQSPVLRQR